MRRVMGVIGEVIGGVMGVIDDVIDGVVGVVDGGD